MNFTYNRDIHGIAKYHAFLQSLCIHIDDGIWVEDRWYLRDGTWSARTRYFETAGPLLEALSGEDDDRGRAEESNENSGRKRKESGRWWRWTEDDDEWKWRLSEEDDEWKTIMMIDFLKRYGARTRGESVCLLWQQIYLSIFISFLYHVFSLIQLISRSLLIDWFWLISLIWL